MVLTTITTFLAVCVCYGGEALTQADDRQNHRGQRQSQARYREHDKTFCFRVYVKIKEENNVGWISLSELKGDEGWSDHKFWRTFPIGREVVKDSCERISYLDIDEQAFVERFERPNIPVVITDCQLEWQATRKWTIEVNLDCDFNFIVS